MEEQVVFGLALILILGVAVQWVSWRIKVPSILLLLLTGFAVGPFSGLINPVDLFGKSLFPFVSLSVAIILFEGGLGLRYNELKGIGHAVSRLILLGALITWTFSSLAAYFILGWDIGLSLLAGAILVVTGPTVVIPLLRYLRVPGNIGTIIRWEGIVNDPVGASLAILVFESIIATNAREAGIVVIGGIAKTILFGSLLGIVGAGILIIMFRKYWIPDNLHSPVTLIVVLGVFVGANFFQPESGLLAVTLMGIILGNQNYFSIKLILEFKENLQVILISSLFIILAARLSLEQFYSLNFSHVLFLLVLIIIVRPLAVYLSTIKSGLSHKEKILLNWMAPRGIVAAAVSSIFALELTEAGYGQADALVPVIFLVIIGTVTFYSLTAKFVALRLKLAVPDPQGLLIVGAHHWAREIAKALHDLKISVLLADANWHHITQARMDGLPVYYGNILSKNALDEIDLSLLGKMLLLTSNDEVNHLAAIHFMDLFETSEIYILPADKTQLPAGKKSEIELSTRILWEENMTFSFLDSAFLNNYEIKHTHLTDTFDLNAFEKMYPDTVYPLFLIDQGGKLHIFAKNGKPEIKGNVQLLALVPKSKSD